MKWKFLLAYIWADVLCVCRSVAVRLESEVLELRRNLQQAVDHKLEAEREKQEAQEQVNKYTPEWHRSADNSQCLISLGKVSIKALRYCQ